MPWGTRGSRCCCGDTPPAGTGCLYISGVTTSTQYEVTLANIADNICSTCASWDGTYTLNWTSSATPCRWDTGGDALNPHLDLTGSCDIFNIQLDFTFNTSTAETGMTCLVNGTNVIFACSKVVGTGTPDVSGLDETFVGIPGFPGSTNGGIAASGSQFTASCWRVSNTSIRVKAV